MYYKVLKNIAEYDPVVVLCVGTQKRVGRPSADM